VEFLWSDPFAGPLALESSVLANERQELGDLFGTRHAGSIVESKEKMNTDAPRIDAFGKISVVAAAQSP
jgi:hypothetical protein